MKNDYRRTSFYIKKINDEEHYYIRVNKQWIAVTKDIYKVCNLSYKKMNYEMKRDDTNLLYTDMDGLFNVVDRFNTIRCFNNLLQNETIKNLLSFLDEDERKLIEYIYFLEMTEREIAKIYHISQPAIHKKKKKILKKLRNRLSNKK